MIAFRMLSGEATTANAEGLYTLPRFPSSMQTGTNPDRCSGMEQASDGSAPTTGTCRTVGRERWSFVGTHSVRVVVA